MNPYIVYSIVYVRFKSEWGGLFLETISIINSDLKNPVHEIGPVIIFWQQGKILSIVVIFFVYFMVLMYFRPILEHFEKKKVCSSSDL